ncbi:MAG TPA: hypothetical protein VNQ79_04360 [Blastocatellia bacterium]|nr:hypothetical protein [Blastocatellia bacterium]
MTEAIGWISSVILLLTIGRQVWKQWQEGASEGVSKWLFIGQIAASAGFTAYSILVGNPIFVITNLLMLLSATAGLCILLWQRHRAAGRHSDRTKNPARQPECSPLRTPDHGV